MNDQPSLNQPVDRRAARRQRLSGLRAEFGEPTSFSTITFGTLLILLGVAFYLENFGIFTIPVKNWDGLIILIPAFWAFDRAGRIFRNAGNQLTPRAKNTFLVGLALIAVMVIVLFELSWTFYGPGLLILTGLGILIHPIK